MRLQWMVAALLYCISAGEIFKFYMRTDIHSGKIADS